MYKYTLCTAIVAYTRTSGVQETFLFQSTFLTRVSPRDRSVRLYRERRMSIVEKTNEIGNSPWYA